ncbi:MAG: copper chaperone CopZ [Planctomycetota bacterium]
MRGALKPFDSVEIVDLEVGTRAFSVKYDKSKISPEQIIAAVSKAGEKMVLTK